MPRLIDAKALFNDLADYWGIPKDWYGQIDKLCEDALASIENAPTVEAVEVVRCRDCKHRGEEGCCPMYFVDEIEWDDDGYTETDYVPHDYTVDDGFCDRGERRTDNA